MDKLVSIIMPVYNSSQFLHESIESVIDQDYINWELICIDDGSTDDSPQILNSYKSKNIKVYSQSNQGPARARKLGISKSIGDYICCLDSDDTYSKDYLSETLSLAIETNADVIMPKLISAWGSEFEYDFNEKHNLLYGMEIKPRDAFLRTFPWTVHSYNLYKSNHMKKYALTDISNINNFNADEYLVRNLLLFSNKIVISNGTYFYRDNTESITNKFSIRQFSSLKVDRLNFDLAIKENFNSKELSQIAKQLLINKVSLKYSYLMNRKSMNYENKNYIEDNLSIKDSWLDYLKIDNLETLKFYIFLKVQNSLLAPAIDLREIIKKRK